MRKYVATFFLSVVGDFVATWSNYAVTHDRVLLAAVLGFALPFVNLLSIMWFIDEKTLVGRIKLTACCAAAYSSGTVLMLLTVSKL